MLCKKDNREGRLRQAVVFPNSLSLCCDRKPLGMGRRNESNRLEHKKKTDHKKKREQEAEKQRKNKLKEIIKKNNASNEAQTE